MYGKRSPPPLANSEIRERVRFLNTRSSAAACYNITVTMHNAYIYIYSGGDTSTNDFQSSRIKKKKLNE